MSERDSDFLKRVAAQQAQRDEQARQAQLQAEQERQADEQDKQRRRDKVKAHPDYLRVQEMINDLRLHEALYLYWQKFCVHDSKKVQIEVEETVGTLFKRKRKVLQDAYERVEVPFSVSKFDNSSVVKGDESKAQVSSYIKVYLGKYTWFSRDHELQKDWHTDTRQIVINITMADGKLRISVNDRATFNNLESLLDFMATEYPKENPYFIERHENADDSLLV